MAAISRATAEHYIWGNGCDGWHLVKDSKLSVIEEQMPAGAAEVLHFHRHAQQFFYVLSGAATMELDGREIHLRAGEGLHIAAGAKHCIRNTTDAPVQFLVISHPPSHGDRVQC